MPRHTKSVTITSEGRDKGKAFILTEFPSDQGERWAHRAMLALSRSGIDLPPGIFAQGMAGLAAYVPYLIVIGIKSLQGAQWAEVEPLLDEMMSCVKYDPRIPGLQPIDLVPGINSQIEEVKTRMELRKEVLMLHVNPFDFAAFQTLERDDTTASNSSDTPTSPPSSEPLSVPTLLP